MTNPFDYGNPIQHITCPIDNTHNVYYFAFYVAYACKECDKWLHTKCKTPEGECYVCLSRPDRPSEVGQETVKQDYEEKSEQEVIV